MSEQTWWRMAVYPWGYPQNPDGKPDSAICGECGPLVAMPWEPAMAVVTYRADVVRGEHCFRCGGVRP